MPESTPREQLEHQMRARFTEMGYDHRWSADMARQSVAEFYDENQEGTYFALVSAEAVQIMLNVMPPFVTHLSMAFETIKQQIQGVAQLGMAMAPYADMIGKAKLERADPQPKYNASGLPTDDGPFSEVVPFQLADDDPECTCNSRSVDLDGEVVHYDTCATNVDVADEVSLADTGRHLDDRITGAPHHYIVNDDHSACGCGGHVVECTTWNDPAVAHAASICGIPRTLCQHSPRHLYRQPCEHDPHVSATGHGMRRFRSEVTEGGEPVYGPVES